MPGEQYNKRRRFFLVLAAVLIAAVAAPADAHDLERTQVSITFSAGGSFVVDVVNDPDWLRLRLEPFAGNDAARLIPAAERDARLAQLGAVFVDRIVLFVDGHEVRPDAAEYIPPVLHAPLDDRPALATFRLRGHVASTARSVRWLYGLVIDPYPLTLRLPDGRSRLEWIDGAAWSGTLDVSGQLRPSSRWRLASRFVPLGYIDVLPNGADHILFFLGLFLLSVTLPPVLAQALTFAVASAIFCALTMFGVVWLPARVVEPMIALSIAYVAIENLAVSELKPWRLPLVFAFGLFHGARLATALAAAAPPHAELVPALIGFEIGVDGALLTVVALAFVCVSSFRGRYWYRHLVAVPASMAIAAIGICWTIVRAAR